MTQGERIKQVRKEKKLTLEKFGNQLGVSKSTLSNIENGRFDASEQMAKAICREFNVSYDWLTKEEGEPFIELLPESEIGSIVSSLLTDGRKNPFYDAILNIVSAYNNLSPRAQESIDELVESVSAIVSKKKED